MPKTTTILLTGANGYVGRQLRPRLVAAGYRVRCLVRNNRPSCQANDGSSYIQGDLLDAPTLKPALQGIDVAYYLVHSMQSDGDFEEREMRCARNFAEAAREAGVRRIIYLGGLAPQEPQLSPHLRSRCAVGQALRDSGVEVIEFRASIVLGSGSLSFELMRSLVERLPAMLTPKWVSVPVQPIHIDDLLRYLTDAIELPTEGARIFQIGGADQVSYRDLMREYARQRGIRRLVIPVPVLTPRLSSLWLKLVAPENARIGRKLIESMRHPTVVTDFAARDYFRFQPRGLRQAMTRILEEEEDGLRRVAWNEIAHEREAAPLRVQSRLNHCLFDRRHIEIDANAKDVFDVLSKLGGAHGWHYANALWRLRGWLDERFGGPGLRRALPRPDRLTPGAALDWWIIEELESDRLLRLKAEMKLPGQAWLEFAVKPIGPNRCVLIQTAAFDPKGAFGRLYWHSLALAHSRIFAGMLHGIARAARSRPRTSASSGLPAPNDRMDEARVGVGR